MNVLPSDRLARRWTWKGWTALGASVAVVAGLGVTAIATGPLAAAVPTPTATYVVPQTAMCSDYRGGICYTPEMQAAADQQEQQIEADNAAKAAAAAAAAQAAAEAAAQQAAAQKAAQQKAAAPAPGAPGSRVPFVASSDPNNANGGDYEDPGIYCQSHSASGNPPICD